MQPSEYLRERIDNRIVINLERLENSEYKCAEQSFCRIPARKDDKRHRDPAISVHPAGAGEILAADVERHIITADSHNGGAENDMHIFITVDIHAAGIRRRRIFTDGAHTQSRLRIFHIPPRQNGDQYAKINKNVMGKERLPEKRDIRKKRNMDRFPPGGDIRRRLHRRPSEAFVDAVSHEIVNAKAKGGHGQ